MISPADKKWLKSLKDLHWTTIKVAIMDRLGVNREDFNIWITPYDWLTEIQKEKQRRKGYTK